MLGLKAGLRTKDLLKAITDLQAISIINIKALSTLIPSPGDDPLQAVQRCELAKDM